MITERIRDVLTTLSKAPAVLSTRGYKRYIVMESPNELHFIDKMIIDAGMHDIMSVYQNELEWFAPTLEMTLDIGQIIAEVEDFFKRVWTDHKVTRTYNIGGQPAVQIVIRPFFMANRLRDCMVAYSSQMPELIDRFDNIIRVRVCQFDEPFVKQFCPISLYY